MLGKRRANPAHKEELKKRRESALEDRKKIKEALQQQENPAPLLSEQELKNSFDEWMKIAADNVRLGV